MLIDTFEEPLKKLAIITNVKNYDGKKVDVDGSFQKEVYELTDTI